MDTTENNNYDQCVTNDTFIEYQNAAEWNKDQRLKSLKIHSALRIYGWESLRLIALSNF